MTTIVAIHLAAAIAAVMLGITILMARRGTPRHRWLGRTWAMTMAVAALSSFGIRELNPGHFSWLHALAAWVLVSLVLAIAAIRRGNVVTHRRSMLGLYTGLIVAGVAAVAVPGRMLNETLARWGHEVMTAATVSTSVSTVSTVSTASATGMAGGEGTR